MRRVLVLVLVAIAACRSASNDALRPVAEAPSARDAGATRAPPSAIAATDAGAVETVAKPEPPLAWGTRPSTDGPLFPIIDGPCGGRIWALGAAVFYQSRRYEGPWSRGGPASFGRFTDEGIVFEPANITPAAPADRGPLDAVQPIALSGAWPELTLMFAEEHLGRMRSYETVWLHRADGWRLLGSYREDGQPSFAPPILYREHVVTARAAILGEGQEDSFGPQSIKTWKTSPDAAAIPGVAALARRGFTITGFVAGDDAIYALGEDGAAGVVRWVKDGRAGEVSLGRIREPVGATKTALYVVTQDDKVERIADGKHAPLPLKLPPKATIRSAAIAPDGDVWILTSTHAIAIARGDAITEAPLPKPSRPAQKSPEPYVAPALAGVELGDPWAIGEGGALFHLDGGAWREVPFPAPPFSTGAHYQAQSLRLPAKGDLYVSASYLEKGIGWPGAVRYDAILRTRRPPEVLRCNDPLSMREVDAGKSFMSFPPIATDACATPFVILLRVAYNMTTSKPGWVVNPKSDYPSVRAAIKATPSLGATVDLVEVVSGDQRYLGARVPSVAAGKELALAVMKKVNMTVVQTPEVVCGTPKEERVLVVDVATGKVK